MANSGGNNNNNNNKNDLYVIAVVASWQLPVASCENCERSQTITEKATTSAELRATL